MSGDVLPTSAPALKDYEAFQQAKTNAMVAEVRTTLNDIHEYIADPGNEQPIPLHIVRDRPEMAAWLNGENPSYAPTVVEYKVIWPAFLERRRKIKERGLAGDSTLDAILALLESRMETQAVVDDTPANIEATLDGISFVPVDLQRSILAALDGKALKKQGLADVVCGGEGTRLYKAGGLKELRATEAKLVDHKNGLGYYRPDRPPKQ